MKKFALFCCFLLGLVQGISAGHIVKSPGSTTDIFSELALHSYVLDPLDTLFIEGGTGDIILQGGPSDNTYYDWDIDGGSLTTWKVTFTYANATATLGDGSKGRMIRCGRGDALGVQYILVVYRTGPLKASTPSGSASVCKGSSANYSSSSTNADSYVWTISPSNAGTTSSTSATASISWSSSFVGTATVTAQGKKDSYIGPASDALSVVVGQAPAKPVISGDNFVKVGTTLLYTASSDGTVSWNISNALASKTASGNDASLTFGSSTGSLVLTVSKTNTCGTSPVSDNFAIEIADPVAAAASAALAVQYANELQAADQEIQQLTTDLTYYKQQHTLLADGSIALSVKTTLGNFDLNFFPNPASGPVTLTSSEIIQDVEIYSPTGSLLYTATPLATSYQFDISAITTVGDFYLIKVTTAKGPGSIKFVRSK